MPSECRFSPGLTVSHWLLKLSAQPTPSAREEAQRLTHELLPRLHNKARGELLTFLTTYYRVYPDIPAGLLTTGRAVIDLSRADFRQSDFRGQAFFADADFSGIDFREADLSNTTLTNTCLRGADLRGARLFRAQLAGADLRAARLEDTKLRNVIAIDQANLQDATYNAYTCWPDKFDPEAAQARNIDASPAETSPRPEAPPETEIITAT